MFNVECGVADDAARVFIVAVPFCDKSSSEAERSLWLIVRDGCGSLDVRVVVAVLPDQPLPKARCVCWLNVFDCFDEIKRRPLIGNDGLNECQNPKNLSDAILILTFGDVLPDELLVALQYCGLELSV